jgi:hypothetical protein
MCLFPGYPGPKFPYRDTDPAAHSIWFVSSNSTFGLNKVAKPIFLAYVSARPRIVAKGGPGRNLLLLILQALSQSQKISSEVFIVRGIMTRRYWDDAPLIELSVSVLRNRNRFAAILLSRIVSFENKVMPVDGWDWSILKFSLLDMPLRRRMERRFPTGLVLTRQESSQFFDIEWNIGAERMRQRWISFEAILQLWLKIVRGKRNLFMSLLDVKVRQIMCYQSTIQAFWPRCD